jgi:hypothetical protein
MQSGRRASGCRTAWPRRWGRLQRQSLDDNEPTIVTRIELFDWPGLHEPLSHPEAAFPRRARVVRLRCCSGLPIPEAAHLLHLSPRSADRLWT